MSDWFRKIITKIIRVNGEEQIDQRALNLVAGAGVTLAVQNREIQGETRVTISAEGGGGELQNLASVLAEGNSAGGLRIQNLGAPTGTNHAARLADIPQGLGEVLADGHDADNFPIENLGYLRIRHTGGDTGAIVLQNSGAVAQGGLTYLPDYQAHVGAPGQGPAIVLTAGSILGALFTVDSRWKTGVSALRYEEELTPGGRASNTHTLTRVARRSQMVSSDTADVTLTHAGLLEDEVPADCTIYAEAIVHLSSESERWTGKVYAAVNVVSGVWTVQERWADPHSADLPDDVEDVLFWEQSEVSSVRCLAPRRVVSDGTWRFVGHSTFTIIEVPE